MLDPGWLFLIAGLAMCAAGILIPAQNDLRALKGQLDALHAEEALVTARLRAHANFLDDLEQADPTLVRRLAAAQLNVVPAGDRPILLARTPSASVIDWIDQTVATEPPPTAGAGLSRLSRLAEGPYRLWALGGSVFCIFIGLLTGVGPAVRRRTGSSARAGRDVEEQLAGEAMADRKGTGGGPASADRLDSASAVATAEPQWPSRGRLEALPWGGEVRPAIADGGAPIVADVEQSCIVVLDDEVTDEADILDEDEAETWRDPAIEVAAASEDGDGLPDTADDLSSASDAGEAATGGEAEETGHIARSTAGSDEPKADDYEYEYVYEEIEVDEEGNPVESASEDGEVYEYEYEYEYVDDPCEDGGDEDDEYEYEYVYVDADEAEAEDERGGG
jgi:hypothetical protein